MIRLIVISFWKFISRHLMTHHNLCLSSNCIRFNNQVQQFHFCIFIRNHQYWIAQLLEQCWFPCEAPILTGTSLCKQCNHLRLSKALFMRVYSRLENIISLHVHVRWKTEHLAASLSFPYMDVTIHLTVGFRHRIQMHLWHTCVEELSPSSIATGVWSSEPKFNLVNR